jgi:hypothetical protein
VAIFGFWFLVTVAITSDHLKRLFEKTQIHLFISWMSKQWASVLG